MENMNLDGDRQIDANFGFTIASAGDLNKDGFNGESIQKNPYSFMCCISPGLGSLCCSNISY
jgi:hypothetical protein